MNTPSALAVPKRPSSGRHSKILAGLAIGTALGIAANTLLGANHPVVRWLLFHVSEPVGQLFLRLLLMMVIPLVFSSLIVGLQGLGDIRAFGRIGIRCLIYCLVISTISVAIGLILANTIRPGKRINPQTAADLQQRYQTEATQKVADTVKAKAKESFVMDVVKSFVPSNPLAAMAADPPNMLHLIFFAVIIGVAILLLPPERTTSLVAALDGLYAISGKIIDLIMAAAPFAVACLMFNNTARFGLDVLIALMWFVATVLIGLALHMFGTYSLALRLLTDLKPLDFFRRIKTVIATAFSTSSSAATLPTTLRVAENELALPRHISSFVLTVGATANQNGTALYEGVTVLFLAQLAGVDLGIGQQILVAYLAILGSIGTAGVPSGSIPFIILVLGTINVNPALIGVVLGVDRILDMCRTTLNVAGDLTAALYVARAESRTGSAGVPPAVPP